MESTVIDEKLIFELDPVDVGISQSRPRQRKDLGEVEKMLDSIKLYGQIQPIVIDREKNLVAGGRRLAACLVGGIKVRACYKDSLDDILLRELELEENIQRKPLSPSEEVLATSELFELKQKRHGKSTPGREGGFTTTDIAELLGKSRGSIAEDLQLAEAVKLFPNLSECKTKSEIKKAVKGLQRVQDSMDALAKFEDIIKKTDRFILVNKKAEDYLAGIGAATVDLFFTDPPYGIDIHDVAMTIGGETGGELNATGTTYDDSENYAKNLLETLCKESYRITKDNGHALIFCAPSHFPWLSDRMRSAGWMVAPRPIVWVKRETGQNNQPDKWFSSAYEFILYARKVNSTLVIQGKPDWLQCDPVLPSERIHQAEKPVELCKELISRVCLPGSYMIDPCMGSGAIIEAGVRMKMLCLGCEKTVETYSLATSRMVKVHDAVKF
jgi:ParB family chromosome partitioning protein